MRVIGLVLAGVLALSAAPVHAQDTVVRDGFGRPRPSIDSMRKVLPGTWLKQQYATSAERVDSSFVTFYPDGRFSVRDIRITLQPDGRAVRYAHPADTYRYRLMYGLGTYSAQPRMCAEREHFQSCNRVSMHTGPDGREYFSFGAYDYVRVKQ